MTEVNTGQVRTRNLLLGSSVVDSEVVATICKHTFDYVDTHTEKKSHST